MKLLMVIPNLAGGGAERAFVLQALALAEIHEVWAYVPWACQSHAPWLETLRRRVRVVSLPLASWVNRLLVWLDGRLGWHWPERWLHWLWLRFLHARQGFELANAHRFEAASMLCDVFAQDDLPLLESDHGDYRVLAAEANAPGRMRKVLQRLDGLICPSLANVQFARRWAWAHCRLIGPMPYAPQLPVSRADSLPKPAGFCFGMVARGISQKGWPELLEAWSLLQREQRIPCARLLLMGCGEDLEQLRRQWADLPAVEWLGWVADPLPIMQQCDVGLLPSAFVGESLPCAVLEFQSLGIPVIASDAGGLPEMLLPQGEACGLTLPLQAATGRVCPSQLAEAMLTLMQDTSLRQRLGAAARRQAELQSAAQWAAQWSALAQTTIHSRSEA